MNRFVLEVWVRLGVRSTIPATHATLAGDAAVSAEDAVVNAGAFASDDGHDNELALCSGCGDGVF